MLRTRVMPVLLLKNRGLYKGVKFKKHQYIGDPINTVRIFNQKEVDELVLFDIEASIKKNGIDFEYIEEVVSEAFMPMAYGGGISNIEQATKLFNLGVEKIIINSAAIENPFLIKELVDNFGSQSVAFSLDVKYFLGKPLLYSRCGKKRQRGNVFEIALQMQSYGVGEIIYNSISHDGMQCGYDPLAFKVANQLSIPVIICGGARGLDDMNDAISAGVHACAASSFFVYHGPHKAVLISYPKYEHMETIFRGKPSAISAM